MAPTLVASYPVYANANNASTLTTPSFTPSNGEVIVVKMATWDTNVSMGAPTGGAQTYASRVINAPGGFAMWTGIYSCVVSGSPGSMTISATPSASCWHSMVVERWAGAQLAATPATGSGTGNGTTPSVTITTTGTNSVVSWVNGDINSRSPSTRAYLSSATEDGLQDGSGGANSVTYYAYQSAAAAGSQTMGMSAPASQRWVLAGIEIQAATASTNTGTISGTLPALTGSLAGAVTDTGSLAGTLPPLGGSVAAGVTDTGTLAGVLPSLAASLAADVRDTVTLAGTLPALTGSAAGTVTDSGAVAGALPALTGSASGDVATAGDLAGTLPALTGNVSGVIGAVGALGGTLPALSGSAVGELPANGGLAGVLPVPAVTLAGDASTGGAVAGALPALTGTLLGTQPDLARAIRVDVHGPALSTHPDGPAARAAPAPAGPAVRRTVDGPHVRHEVDGIGV